jgi:hypothetical protein
MEQPNNWFKNCPTKDSLTSAFNDRMDFIDNLPLSVIMKYQALKILITQYMLIIEQNFKE